MRTGSRPKRPVRASGKASAAKAMKCMSLSLPSGAGGRRLQGPEHRDGQGERHNYGEGDVEVLAHATRLTAPGAEGKWKLSLGGFVVK